MTRQLLNAFDYQQKQTVHHVIENFDHVTPTHFHRAILHVSHVPVRWPGVVSLLISPSTLVGMVAPCFLDRTHVAKILHQGSVSIIAQFGPISGVPLARVA